MLLFLLCCLLAGGRQALAADPEAAVAEDPAAVLRAQKRADLLREVQAPEGFRTTIFATPNEANYPVFVAATVDGTLFVSSDGNGSLGRDPQRGRIVRLRDTDNDGHADEVKEFVGDIDSPRGLLWVELPSTCRSGQPTTLPMAWPSVPMVGSTRPSVTLASWMPRAPMENICNCEAAAWFAFGQTAPASAFFPEALATF